MEDKIKVPFTDSQVEKLNQYQEKGFFHPFTCCSAGSEEKCERRNHKGEGLLIATNEGWVCPCGEYKQDWAHTFMGT
jgi:hypothetical protein